MIEVSSRAVQPVKLGSFVSLVGLGPRQGSGEWGRAGGKSIHLWPRRARRQGRYAAAEGRHVRVPTPDASSQLFADSRAHECYRHNIFIVVYSGFKFVVIVNWQGTYRVNWLCVGTVWNEDYSVLFCAYSVASKCFSHRFKTTKVSRYVQKPTLPKIQSTTTSHRLMFLFVKLYL